MPVLPVNNNERDANHNRGAGIFPAENQDLLLEDEPSYCIREVEVWKLKQVDIRNNQGMIVANRERSSGAFQPPQIGQGSTKQSAAGSLDLFPKY